MSPATALAVGLNVDVDALPHDLRNALRRGRVDLTDPATTLALLKLDAVVRVRGFFDDGGQRLQTVGITCAWSSTTINSSRVEPCEVVVGPRDTFSYRNKPHRAT